MITIDGSIGEGGGQILRTSLALSMVTGQPFRITRIRANREKPGLLRQHLTAVNAAAAISHAAVEGAAVGSAELTFAPDAVRPGVYTFSVGTAGSTTLVLQTVLPALLTAAGPSSLTLEGGTHNPFAPPMDFLEKAFLPLLNRMGPTVNLTMERAGFYPAGGGRWFVNITPTTALEPLHLPTRGAIVRRQALAAVAGLPGSIALRELSCVERRLGWQSDELQIRQWPADWGPGNVLMLEIHGESVTEVFTSFGMRGVSSEAVADRASDQVRQYLRADVAVGPNLADQLLLPLALAGGGSFTTLAPTPHTTTQAETISQFLPIRFTTTRLDDHRHQFQAHAE